MHSVMNAVFAEDVLKNKLKVKNKTEVFKKLSNPGNSDLRAMVVKRASEQGMLFLPDTSGTNIDVQIFDTAKIRWQQTSFPLVKLPQNNDGKPVIVVMDYAFGEQAYETIDELLKPFNKAVYLNVESVSVMGKAGILFGGKGDIMIP